jgi:ubiquinone/menaquinone biosynthesis C-methylase UbiE
MERPKTSQGTRSGGGRSPQTTSVQAAPGKPGFFSKIRAKVSGLVVGWLAKHVLSQSEGAVVLEAGAGTAQGASLLLEMPRVGLSVALDLNMQNLRIARQRDPKLSLVRGDLFRLPFKHNSFDLVWNNSTLERIHDKRRVICEMIHAAKKGGCIFLGVPYARGPLMIQPWISGTQLGKKIGHPFDEQSLTIDIEGTGVVFEKFATFYYRCFLGCLARKE